MAEITPVIDVAAAVAPVSEAAPSGRDIRYEAVFDELSGQRRRAEIAEGDAAQAAEWAKLADLAHLTLSKRSKHLQVAVWLADALTRLEGFRGAYSGLLVLHGLIDKYWESLYPAIDASDSEPLSYRSGPMIWIADRFPFTLKSVPLSDRPPYSLLHFEATLKTGEEREALLHDGWPTGEQFRAAMQNSTPAFLQQTLEEIDGCLAAVKALEALADARFVENVDVAGEMRQQPLLSFAQMQQVLDDGRMHVGAAVQRLSAAGSQTASGGTVSGATADSPDHESTGLGEARTLVLNNQVEGLRLLQSRVTTAPSGRERLLRQLQFAEVCLEARMHTLALPMFRDITTIIKDRKLETWEREEVILRAWRGLKACCDPANGSADLRAMFDEAEQELARLIAQTSSPPS